MQQLAHGSLDLPVPITNYFAQEADGSAAIAECFTADAVVIDEARTHEGRAAIAAWHAAAAASVGARTMVLHAESEGEHTTVRGRVSGEFPGSPVDLQFHFTCADGLIARLEIGA